MAEAQQQKGISELDKALDEFNVNQGLPKAEEKKQKAVGAKKVGTIKKRAPRKKLIVRKGKRKEAVARASMIEGKGEIRINGVNVELINPKELRELILEPIRISKRAEDLLKNYNVNINVYGGGVMGQAQASRTALAKTIVDASQSDELRRAYMLYDRHLLVDDHRRVEPKKFLGPKARARTQTSYR